jgi:3-hydroxyisobutyrate dehydrogenase-like beta-hydroxyacid dehydrogenase
MTSITVLGLGPMGQALSGALLDTGHRIVVWNRTESRADALRTRGAAWSASPAEAVGASELTLVNVVDHDVVDSLLTTVGDAIGGRLIVGLSSDTPHRARQTAKLVESRGGDYLDGAIMTPTETIGTPSTSVLFAVLGDRTTHIAPCSRRWVNRLGSAKTMRRRLRHVAP